jgi:uncharacterized protein YkwD
MRRVAISVVVMLLAFPFSAPGQKTPKESPTTEQRNSQLIKSEQGLLSKQEDEILAEINLARANPSLYIRYLEDFRRKYKGNDLKFGDHDVVITNEGVAAVDDAIKFLRSAKPAGPLELRKGMVFAARDHVTDMVKTGISGHKGSDGSLVRERLNRHGTWKDALGENIVYRSRSPRENVIGLIIDDGVSNRGHRMKLFNSDFHVIGIALGNPAKTDPICVITFAGGFVDKASQDPKSGTPAATRY